MISAPIAPARQTGARSASEQAPNHHPFTTLVQTLDSFGDTPALVTPTEALTYRDLAQRVSDASEQLGTQRRLVMHVAHNSIQSIVWYLAALATHNPLVLLPPGGSGDWRELTESYDPDIVIADVGVEFKRAQSRHKLHEDLALLMTTSGSTGSPKLVRLSHTNLIANATSIADYLQLRASDVAITTLPIGYCYGLSVINSHLVVGATLAVTDLSVVDPCFWTFFEQVGATNFAGVPYTFDLLDRVGFAEMELPTLRFVTQAGGRLAPERVQALSQQGQRAGWDLFVMYGQTEATARMAYLPPDLARTAAGTIGIPIPGGSFTISPDTESTDPGVGELIYTGANVMMGYARSGEDLAVGGTISCLRTGDIARRRDDGLYEIIGRQSRFLKAFGKRIDLDHVEQNLASRGILAHCLPPAIESSNPSESMIVAVTKEVSARHRQLRAIIASLSGLPATAITIVAIDQIPRTSSGKLDATAIRVLAVTQRAQEDQPPRSDAERIRQLYAELLNKPGVSPADSFVSLGGDSMSYVEMSVRLEEYVRDLPAHWHLMSIAELADVSTAPEKSGTLARLLATTARIETNVILRALAIFIVVGSHVTVFDIRGGAHLLVAIAGYNFARFHLAAAQRVERAKRIGRSIARVAIPSALWMLVAVLISSEYSIANALFLHNFVAPEPDSPAWRYWFVEALLYVLVAALLIVSVPAFARWERRAPFTFALGLVAVGLIFRYGLIGDPNARSSIYTPWMIFFLFALGWAIAKAHTWPQRVTVIALTCATVPGFSASDSRILVIIGGICVMVLIPKMRIPRITTPLIAAVASASLFIYLVHWQVYPIFGDANWTSVATALAAGIAVHRAYAALTNPITRRVPSLVTRLRAYSTDRDLASRQTVTNTPKLRSQLSSLP